MRFVLEIELGNSEMETCTQVAMALDNVADGLRLEGDAIPDGDYMGSIRDVNGNNVGAWSVS